MRIRSAGGKKERMGVREFNREVSVEMLRRGGGRRRTVMSAGRVDQGHLVVWPEDRRDL